MNDLAWILFKTSIKTQWDLNHKGDYITVINWWSPTLVSGERIILNERTVIDQVNWLPKVGGAHEFRLEDGQPVKVLMGSTRWGTTGCHIYINGQLVGGDIHKKLVFPKR